MSLSNRPGRTLLPRTIGRVRRRNTVSRRSSETRVIATVSEERPTRQMSNALKFTFPRYNIYRRDYNTVLWVPAESFTELKDVYDYQALPAGIRKVRVLYAPRRLKTINHSVVLGPNKLHVDCRNVTWQSEQVFQTLQYVHTTLNIAKTASSGCD